jgi:hypothetical protein
MSAKRCYGITACIAHARRLNECVSASRCSDQRRCSLLVLRYHYCTDAAIITLAFVMYMLQSSAASTTQQSAAAAYADACSARERLRCLLQGPTELLPAALSQSLARVAGQSVLQQALLRATAARWTAAPELLQALLLPEVPVSTLRYAELDNVAVELCMWGCMSSTSSVHDAHSSSHSGSSDVFAWRKGITETADDASPPQVRDRSSSSASSADSGGVRDETASSSAVMEAAAASTPLQQSTQQKAATAAVAVAAAADNAARTTVKQEGTTATNAGAAAAAASSDDSSKSMVHTDSLEDGAAVLCLTMYDTAAAVANTNTGELSTHIYMTQH